MNKKVLVCGAGGFIGQHLVTELKKQGHYVIGADLTLPAYSKSDADKFFIVDLRDKEAVSRLVIHDIDEIFQLAADMGGAGYIFTGKHDADIMTNSALINLNILSEMAFKGIQKIFYASSACIYPDYNQQDKSNPNCEESSAYPANPDSEYGWEKLFSERLYLSYAKNYNIQVRIARLHNVFGPLSPYQGGKEKAPCALCRKVADSNGTVEIWGDGSQTRSFLFIEDCIEGIVKIMNSNHATPINLGSTRMISIKDLVFLIAKIANKQIQIKSTPGPVGVNGRNSHNVLIKSLLDWEPTDNLEYGLKITYDWIYGRLHNEF